MFTTLHQHIYFSQRRDWESFFFFFHFKTFECNNVIGSQFQSSVHNSKRSFFDPIQNLEFIHTSTARNTRIVNRKLCNQLFLINGLFEGQQSGAQLKRKITNLLHMTHFWDNKFLTVAFSSSFRSSNGFASILPSSKCA